MYVDDDSVFDALITSNFKDAYSIIDSMVTTKGYALNDILTEVAHKLFTAQLPPKPYAYLVSELSNIEYSLSFGTSDKLQMGALVGAFAIARSQMAQMA